MYHHHHHHHHHHYWSLIIVVCQVIAVCYNRADADGLRRELHAARAAAAASEEALRECRGERDRLVGRLVAAEILAGKARGAAEEVAAGAAAAAAGLHAERTALAAWAMGMVPQTQLEREQERAGGLQTALDAAAGRISQLEQVANESE